MELVDTSVWAQKENPRIKPWFDTALVGGELAICDQIALEILAGTLYRETRGDLRGMPWLRMDADDRRRALEVYDLLEEHGTNIRRSVKIADLLIAACGERHGLPIVHYDHDFETIASVTGQPARWVAPPGSLQQAGLQNLPRDWSESVSVGSARRRAHHRRGTLIIGTRSLSE